MKTINGFVIRNKLASDIASILRAFTKSHMEVDVIIPCTEKSMKVLPWVVASLRRYLRHPIGEIFVISGASEAIRQFCNKEGIVNIDETEFMGFGNDEIVYFPDNVDRRGWLYQQLIKLKSDVLGNAKHLLILDSDTVFIRPARFDSAGSIALQYFEYTHPSYMSHLRKLFPDFEHTQTSFICHHMFLNKSTLANIRKDIELLHPGKSWWKTIIDLVDTSQMSGFSEYETIGHYIVNNNLKDYGKNIEHYLNCGMTLTNWMSRFYKRVLFPAIYKTISFQQYC